ncbi:hypothetical protein IOCL2690_000298700 [Leishmania lindenbergi]|uniref:Secreted protein n=1 Tax=Leishmania lindenbergi TaxID=651832 RepID=A0AAW3AL76_9TRYP
MARRGLAPGLRGPLLCAAAAPGVGAGAWPAAETVGLAVGRQKTLVGATADPFSLAVAPRAHPLPFVPGCCGPRRGGRLRGRAPPPDTKPASPITRKVDAGVLPSRTLAAARVGRGVQCSRVHLTPIAQQASEDGTRKDGKSLQGARVDWAAGGPSLTASI